MLRFKFQVSLSSLSPSRCENDLYLKVAFEINPATKDWLNVCGREGMAYGYRKMQNFRLRILASKLKVKGQRFHTY